MTPISARVAASVTAMPTIHQSVVSDVLNELHWQLENPEHLRIYNDRYYQLAQEAALTIAQAVKVKNGGETVAKIPLEHER